MKYLLLTLSLTIWSISTQAQSQLAMSFTGNYNIANNDLNNHFENGIGGSAELYYYFNNSPFAVSINFSINQFNATPNYLKEYKSKQENIIDFSYSINYYTIPVILSVNYRFFCKKTFQPSIGIGAGYYSLTHKIKQKGEYTSDTKISPYHEFGIYPHIALIYAFHKNIGIFLKAGYNQTFNSYNTSYTDIRLGLIYKI